MEPYFIRSFNDWEMEDVEKQLMQLGNKRVFEGMEDTVRWTRTKNGTLSIKAMYKAFEQRPFSSFPWKCIRKCRNKEERIGGKNSSMILLIHCEYIYIYAKVNLIFLIDYNCICKVDICYNTPPQVGA